VGSLVDALQITQITFGDVTMVAGGTSGFRPGTGMVTRANRLMDVAQDLIGDINRVVGSPVHRSQGLIHAPWLVMPIDGLQQGLGSAFHTASISVGRTFETGMFFIDSVLTAPAQLIRRPPCQQRTVFFIMPRDLYESHRDVFVNSWRQVYVGTRQELLAMSHQALFHRRRLFGRIDRRWSNPDRLPPSVYEVIVVMDRSGLARLPDVLSDYIVPPGWVFAEPSVLMKETSPDRAVRDAHNAS